MNDDLAKQLIREVTRISDTIDSIRRGGISGLGWIAIWLFFILLVLGS